MYLVICKRMADTWRFKVSLYRFRQSVLINTAGTNTALTIAWFQRQPVPKQTTIFRGLLGKHLQVVFVCCICLQVMTCLSNVTQLEPWLLSTMAQGRQQMMFACAILNLAPNLTQPQKFFFSKRFVIQMNYVSHRKIVK